MINPMPADWLENLDLSVRSFHALQRAGIFTIPQLWDYIENHSLQEIRCIGTISEKEIIRALRNHAAKEETQKASLSEGGVTEGDGGSYHA